MTLESLYDVEQYNKIRAWITGSWMRWSFSSRPSFVIIILAESLNLVVSEWLIIFILFVHFVSVVFAVFAKLHVSLQTLLFVDQDRKYCLESQLENLFKYHVKSMPILLKYLFTGISTIVSKSFPSRTSSPQKWRVLLFTLREPSLDMDSSSVGLPTQLACKGSRVFLRLSLQVLQILSRIAS